MEKKLVYTGKTKNVYALENGNYLLKFKDDYHDSTSGQIKPEEAPVIKVTYKDFLRERTINAYLGQSIEADLVEYDGEQYWESIRLAFPER